MRVPKWITPVAAALILAGGWILSDLIDRETGELTDFLRRPGDPPIGQVSRSKRDKWGGRFLLTNDPALLNATPSIGRRQATLIETPDLGMPRPIDIQIQFALDSINAGTTHAPLGFFNPIFPIQNVGTSFLQFRQRRAFDPSAPLQENNERITTFPEQYPFDIVVARQLGIDVELAVGAPIMTVWIDSIAAIVDVPAVRNQIPGWGNNLTTNPAIPAENFVAASAVSIPLLAIDNPARATMIIVNTSTNADLALGFGRTPRWVPTPRGSIILPRNMFSSYEGAWTGAVFGIWSDPVPNGGALVTEGAFFR
jgi:hypothetical protein